MQSNLISPLRSRRDYGSELPGPEDTGHSGVPDGNSNTSPFIQEIQTRDKTACRLMCSSIAGRIAKRLTATVRFPKFDVEAYINTMFPSIVLTSYVTGNPDFSQLPSELKKDKRIIARFSQIRPAVEKELADMGIKPIWSTSIIKFLAIPNGVEINYTIPVNVPDKTDVSADAVEKAVMKVIR